MKNILFKSILLFLLVSFALLIFFYFMHSLTLSTYDKNALQFERLSGFLLYWSIMISAILSIVLFCVGIMELFKKDIKKSQTISKIITAIIAFIISAGLEIFFMIVAFK